MGTDIDIEYLRGWIGRRDETSDVVTSSLASRFQAVFEGGAAGDVRSGEQAPLGLHWCLGTPLQPMSEIGEDGHPATGGFLPPMPLPRRMWASGALSFSDRLRIDDQVTITTTVEDVAAKQGRSGLLCFVTLKKVYETSRSVAICETQNIVYREPEKPAQPVTPRTASSADRDGFPIVRTMYASEVLLFRYSAITFNAHRIHYDSRYAIEVENYPDLVVHGPLQATLLLQLAQEKLPDPVTDFEFRGVAPLFAHDTFSLRSGDRPAGGLALQVCNGAGEVTMTASARDDRRGG
jgi:3-methylfumaryl-CoA hydratase